MFHKPCYVSFFFNSNLLVLYFYWFITFKNLSISREVQLMGYEKMKFVVFKLSMNITCGFLRKSAVWLPNQEITKSIYANNAL